jgi:DNA-binding transcriptional MerR regulator
MTKSPDAFRTISEVAEWLDRPTHVLRFWESKFTQLKPIKRAGGRRYYRPEDMLLLGGIKKLLHDDGMTIKGVQKLLREQGVAHVAELSQSLDVIAPADQMVPSPEKVAALKDQAETPESATLLKFPHGADAAEEEVAQTTYEKTVEELTPDDIPQDSSQETPPAVSEPPAPEADFEAPSFFNMFDALDPAAAEEAPKHPEADAEITPDPVETPPAGPAPKMVEVPVEASSTKGPGVLSRLWKTTTPLPASEQAHLSELRQKLRALSNRMQTG